jgi:hypothetical protein
MKTFIPLFALVVLAASSSLFAQTPAFSKPSGYVTQTLSQGFNVFGFGLVPPATTTGSFTSVSSNSVADSTKDFSALLVAGATYTLEITSGSATLNGTVTEITTFSSGTLNTIDNLSAAGAIVGTTYTLRKAPTLSEVFGTTGSVLAKSNSITTADVLHVPSGGGQYTRYHQRTDGNWRNATTNTITGVNSTPLIYLDGAFLERKSASPVDLVLTGQVKTTPTISSIANGFNLLGTVYPAGATLQTLGLENDLVGNNNINTADVVHIPTGNGTYARYHLRTDGVTWRNATTNTINPPSVPITSAIFIERKTTARSLSLTPPVSYSGL